MHGLSLGYVVAYLEANRNALGGLLTLLTEQTALQ